MTTPTTKYLIFAGETYYPAGGWDDLYGRAETIEGALEIMGEALFVGSRSNRQWGWGIDTNALQGVPREWAEIVSLETMKKVEDPRIDAIRADKEERIRYRNAEYEDSIVLTDSASEEDDSEEEESKEEPAICICGNVNCPPRPPIRMREAVTGIWRDTSALTAAWDARHANL